MKTQEYNNHFRGKFVVDVTIRLTVATREDGLKGFNEVSRLLADAFPARDHNGAYSWSPNIEAAVLQKIVPTELAVPSIVEIPEEEPAQEEA